MNIGPPAQKGNSRGMHHLIYNYYCMHKQASRPINKAMNTWGSQQIQDPDRGSSNLCSNINLHVNPTTNHNAAVLTLKATQVHKKCMRSEHWQKFILHAMQIPLLQNWAKGLKSYESHLDSSSITRLKKSRVKTKKWTIFIPVSHHLLSNTSRQT